MKKYRYLLMTATLLMSAQAGFAMSPSVASLQAMLAAGQQQPPAAQQAHTDDLFSEELISEVLPSVCPVMGHCSWFSYLYQHGMSACQRFCSRNSRGAVVCQPDSACCEEVAGVCATAGPTACKKAGCCAGTASCCAKGTSAAQAQKCCCAKACACCESCKKAGTESSACDRACPLGVAPRFGMVWDSFVPPMPFAEHHRGPWVLPVPHGAWTGPVPQMTPHHSFAREARQVIGAGQPRVIAVGPVGVAVPPVPFHVVRQPMSGCAVAPAQHAHLVTPDLEAHCERMIHKGEMIMLEGEVRLVSRKNGQHIRIEAHRVLLNMKDGTFTVESDVCPARTSQFGVLRTSAETAVPHSPYGVPHNPVVERIIFQGIQAFPVPIPVHETHVPVPFDEMIPAHNPQ